MSSLLLVKKPAASLIKGTIQLNGSKSISNRVLIIDALCGHRIAIENLSNADDTVFLQKALQSKEDIIDAGAGGTTFRFLTAFLATQAGREVILTGTERIQQRPIKILVEALRKLGADIEYTTNDGFPPLKIKGKKLKGGKITLPADTSSQYITALLLIAPTLEEGLEMELLGTIVSVPYIKMTLKMIEYFGVKTSFVGNRITVQSGNYAPKPFFVEGDWSAASYFYSIAILSEDAALSLKGLTTQQIQGDSVIAEIAEKFGIETTYQDNTAFLKKTKNILPESLEYDFLECPDLAQTVVAFCAALRIKIFCKGLQTLRIKETDRIAALDNELQKLKLATLKETGENSWSLSISDIADYDNTVSIATYEDHRMAMAFAPLALRIEQILIEEPNVVTKSYPLFWNDLEKLGFSVKALI